MELSDRKLKVLSALIETYIHTGEPVGSKALQESLDRAVSSATIRNDMAELAELGLIEQPHTSAGRVPSPRGYRLYIDRLMNHRPVTREEKRLIDELLGDSPRDPERLMLTASRALAELTQFAALSTTPESETAVIVKCELIPAAARTAIIVLLTSTGLMKSRLCRSDAELTPQLCQVFRSAVSDAVCGRTLSEISPPFVQTLAASLGEFAFSATPLLIGLYETAEDAAQSELRLEGQSNLLMHPGFTGPQLRELLDFLSRRQQLKGLLDQLHGGVRVMLGPESHRPELTGSSMVVARYHVGSREAGAIGVVGPDRMNYAKIIPSLEYFAKRLGTMLSETLSPPEQEDGSAGGKD